MLTGLTGSINSDITMLQALCPGSPALQSAASCSLAVQYSRLLTGTLTPYHDSVIRIRSASLIIKGIATTS